MTELNQSSTNARPEVRPETRPETRPEALKTLLARRSVKARDMAEPGPSKADMEQILTAALRVPDHGKLAPWRYIVLESSDREKLGKLISHALTVEAGSSPQTAEKMKDYAVQGPTLLVAVYSPSDARPIPEWEQQLSMGASVMNLLNAATALGYASQWLTGWASYSPTVARGLGLTVHEKIAGLVFLGSHKGPAVERPRPLLEEKVRWGFPDTAGHE